MRLSLIAPLALFGFLLTSPAYADDFTFTVPVRIENMTHLESAQVSCDVYREARAISIGAPVAVPVRDGRFVGNVTAIVNVASGFTRADAQRYACILIYRFRMPDGTLFSRSVSGAERNADYARYTGQVVASSMLEVRGTIAP